MTSEATLTGERNAPIVLGRYMLCEQIGGGGMATVHIGRVIGAGGFSRVVAIKRLHAASAADPEVSTMLIDEARLVSRIRHPNVVPTLDVVAVGIELLLVMEYVHGVSLAHLVRIAKARNERIPMAIASRVVVDALAGLEAAHDAKSERGRPLEIVHRDISPQNIIVDAAGISRIVDFGIAKAEGKLSMTRHGQIKGKLGYMSPEQLRGEEVDRRTDIYAAGVVLWELAAGRRLFDRRMEDIAAILKSTTSTLFERPTQERQGALDDALAKALHPTKEMRFATADEMATAIAHACPPASPKEVAAYVNTLAGSHLGRQNDVVERAEQLSEIHDLPPEVVRRPTSTPSHPSPSSPPQGPPPDRSQSSPPKAPPMPMAVATPPPFVPPMSTMAARPAYGAQDDGHVAPFTPHVPHDSPDESLSVVVPVQSLRRWVLGIGVLAGIALGLTVAFVMNFRRGPSPASPALSASFSPLPPPASAASAASASAPTIIADSRDDVPEVDPPAPPPATKHRVRPRPPSPSASVPPRPNCDPPYSIDARGIRIPRRECLDR